MTNARALRYLYRTCGCCHQPHATRKTIYCFLIVASAMAAGCPSSTGAQRGLRTSGGFLLTSEHRGSPTSTIVETFKPPRIDGKLHDWPRRRFFALEYQPLSLLPTRHSETSVKVAFCYDLNRLYVALQVKDGTRHVPFRAWRHGDGFMLTLGDPSNRSTTSRFVTLGFAGTSKGKQVVVVNRNGHFFPSEPVKDIAFAHRVDKEAGLVTYEASIPWRHLDPFRPLVHRSWGINVIYTDNLGKGRGSSKRMLVPDQFADAEFTSWRRVRTFHFAPRPRRTQCQVSLRRRFVLIGYPLPLTLGCTLSTDRGAPYRVEAEMRVGGRLLARQKHDMTGATTTWRVAELSLRAPKSIPTGDYQVVIRLRRGSQLLFHTSRKVFVVGADGLMLYAAWQKLERSGRANHPLLPSLAIRVRWLLHFIFDRAPSADPAPLKKILRESRMLVRLLQSPTPAFKQRGVSFRFAHRSAIDGTLQPYSLFVPPQYDPRRPPPLLVVLHGSGVDEQRTIQGAIRRYKKTGWMILAPKARGLSSWYLGPAGDDVVEAVRHVGRLMPYNRKRVYLLGFSMGGYGAWKISLSHPQMFRAVVVLSGGVFPQTGGFRTGPNVMDLLRRNKRPLPAYLVVHGGRDKSVSVGPVRRLVQQLKAQGVSHRYVERSRAEHGNYSVAKQVIGWLRQYR